MPTEAFTIYIVSCGACGNTLRAGYNTYYESVPAAVRTGRTHGWLIHDDGGAPVCPARDTAHLEEIKLAHPAALNPDPNLPT